MSKYIIKVQGTEDMNPEFAPASELLNGLEADGFVILGTKNGKHCFTVIHGVSTMDIATMLARDGDESENTIQQAIAIAEGLKKAREIEMNGEKIRMAKGLAEILKMGK